MHALPLYPLLVTQGLWVASRAKRMSEPVGPRKGAFGQGPDLRLLILGDSSAAGVGVAHQDQALSGYLSRGLARDHRVHWTLCARCGATSQTTLARMERELDGPFDVALIALGMNDVKNGLRFSTWTHYMTEILDRLTDQHACKLIVPSGLPPVEHVPLLPHPLKWAMAGRAHEFDEALQREAASRENCAFLRTHLEDLIEHMAEDGFHPGEGIYKAWAAEAEALIRSRNPVAKTSQVRAGAMA